MARNRHLIEYFHRGSFDEVYTPRVIAEDFADFIRREFIAHGMSLGTVWECTDHGDSEIAKAFRELGISVISTHISRGQDFLTFQPTFDFDIIVTNPPYSKKDAFIERCFALRKPFALLLPVTAIAGKRRCRVYERL